MSVIFDKSDFFGRIIVTQSMKKILDSIFRKLLILFSRNIFRELFYEIFFRCHQLIDVLTIYIFWRHIQSFINILRFYVYALLKIITVSIFMKIISITYRNFVFRQFLFCAKATHVKKTVQFELNIFRQIHVNSNNYVNLWIFDLTLSFLFQNLSIVLYIHPR